ncbi:MAG: rhodanese-like domain-containing protein [Planctomycetota bacterium]|jgi:hydroxyacylglutathione hydrolase
MLFRQIFDPDLAQYAYLIGCQKTGEAIVIDPERDIERYVKIAEGENLRITAVAETHIHADFLSGSRQFANQHGTRVYLSDEGDADWKYSWPQEDGVDAVFLKNDATFMIGKIELRAVHTPGHTPEHIAYLVTDRGGGADEVMGIASGDFIFVGDLGRPDLLETAAGVENVMVPSARRLYQSVQGIADYADHMQVWPGHGAGSACGKALGAVPTTTIGYERRFSPALGAARDGEDAFVDYILDAQPEPPMYFADMKRLNKIGPPVLEGIPQPEPIDAARLQALATDGEHVVLDTRRDRRAFAAGHLAGSIHTPIDHTNPTVAGSMVPHGAKMVLVADPNDVEEAVTRLIRIGLDNVVAFASTDELGRLDLVRTEVVSFTDVKRLQQEGATVLDVRRDAEYREGHFDGAVNIPHTRLYARQDEIPEGQVIVHCLTGERADPSSSFVERLGRTVYYVDDDLDQNPGVMG